MKIKSLISCVALFCVASIFTSCKENKNQNKEHSHTENTVEYQCPMDCEDGKTYDSQRQCPVCKMDLALIDHKEITSCTVHEDGNCTCDDDKCSCSNCKEHTS